MTHGTTESEREVGGGKWTKSRGSKQRTENRETLTETRAMIVITIVLIMLALHGFPLDVCCYFCSCYPCCCCCCGCCYYCCLPVVWFIVYTPWSVSDFLIAEISWSRDLLRSELCSGFWFLLLSCFLFT